MVSDEPKYELELTNSRHTARVWETVSGWVWSCKRCEARGLRLPDEVEAMIGAFRHMRAEVPWWRKALDRIAQ